MKGIHKLSLEEALPLNDNPQNQTLVGVFEQDSGLLKKYVKRLFVCSKQVANAQSSLTAAVSSLSEHLKFYELQKFPLDSDEESILTTTVKQFSKVLDDLSLSYQVVSTQLQDGMLFPLSKFLDADFNEIDSLAEMYHTSILGKYIYMCFINNIKMKDRNQITAKYSKLSKKKDSDKLSQDLNTEFYSSSKKLHKISINYFAQLNALQYKRKIAIIEPMLACIHAYKSHFSIGNDSMNSDETNNFLSDIGASVQGVYADLGSSTQATVKQIEGLEQCSESLYYAETPDSFPVVFPNTTLIQKAGYLFLRSKIGGMVTKWEKVFVFTQGGNLLHINQGEVGGACIMELDFRVTAQHNENEDRRFVFHVTNGKKSVILQALNAKERDEWIATIRNVVKEEGYSKDPTKRNPIDRRRSSNFFVEKSKRFLYTYFVILLFSDLLSADKSGPLPMPMESSPMERLNLDNPIQFDLLGPNDEEVDSLESVSESDDSRVNPFDESARRISSSGTNGMISFSVKLLGSTSVRIDRGDRMVFDTMRQVLAARAIYNVFKMVEAKMFISTNSLRLVDPVSHATRVSFPMHDVSYWASHKENNRLFGFIVRIKSTDGNEPSFCCYIFESDVPGEEEKKASKARQSDLESTEDEDCTSTDCTTGEPLDKEST
ncbi:DCC-interacting protein 13-alpha [Nymphon striatum]|nr:DCC-interacting protein 13-alpha [Nymphon striatum]